MSVSCPDCDAPSHARDLGFCSCCDWEADWFSPYNEFDELVPLRKWRVTVRLKFPVWDGKDGFKEAVRHVTFKAVKAHSGYYAQERALDRFLSTHREPSNCIDCSARVVPLG